MELKEIGVGAVLDVRDLRDGDYVTLKDHNQCDGVFQIKLLDKGIVLRPVLGKELLMYQLKDKSRFILCGIILIIIGWIVRIVSH